MPSPINNTVQQPQTNGGLSGLMGGVGNFVKNYTPIGLAAQGIGDVIGGVKNLIALPGQQADTAQAGQNAQALYNQAAGAGANVGSSFQSSFGSSPNAYNASQNPGQTNSSESTILPTAYAQTAPSTGTIPPTTSPAATPSVTPPTTPPAPASAPTPPATNNFPGLVSTLGATAGTSSPQYQAAYADYLQNKSQLGALQNQAAQQNINILGSRTNLQEAGGEQGLMSSLEAQEEAQYTQQMQADTNILSAATGQQGTQQSGLAAAAGLAAPTPAQALGFFNPAQGNVTGYQSDQGNGIYGAGAIQNEQSLGAQANTLTATQNQARGIMSQLQSTFASNPDINPTSLTLVNGLVQLGANQIGNPGYQTFSNNINDLINRYSQILTPAGGNVTDARLQIAQSLINPQATPASIMQVLNSLDNQATAVIQGLNTGGATSNGPIGSTTSNTQTPSGYTPFFGNQ